MPLPGKRSAPSNTVVSGGGIGFVQDSSGMPQSLTDRNQPGPGQEWLSQQENRGNVVQARDAAPLDKSLAGDFLSSTSCPSFHPLLIPILVII